MEVLGIDIGGSGIKGAPVDIETGKLTANRYRIPTPDPATPEAIAKTVHKIVKHFKWQGAVGCGFPAAIYGKRVSTASNIDAEWIGKNVSKLFSKTTGLETVVVNDADAAGLAEMAFGAGKGHQGVVFVITVGTGLGTAAFTNGHLFPNMELGHLEMNGKIAELYASDAIRRKEDLSWKKWSKRFNQYLERIEDLFWPDMIILGGGISKKTEKYFHLLETRAELVPAQLLNEAGIIGAAATYKFLT
ncbi:MAG: ROK family protein [Calditrichales bacterium]|nr:MAG: ROK family protein [Calditrichales bacterium]